MEMIEHVHGLGKVLTHGPDVGLAHVGGHGLDLGSGSTQPLPEGTQGVGPFAVADMDRGSGGQVQNRREIGVAFADRDLVDGDFLEVLEFRPAKATLQVPLLNVLDDIPTDVEVTSRVLDGRGPRQLQGIAFEGMRVGSAWVGEGDLDLAGALAVGAKDACNLEEDKGRFHADGPRLQEALLVSLAVNGCRATRGAAVAFAGLLDGEARAAVEKLGPAVFVAADTEHVIQ